MCSSCIYLLSLSQAVASRSTMTGKIQDAPNQNMTNKLHLLQKSNKAGAESEQGKMQTEQQSEQNREMQHQGFHSLHSEQLQSNTR